MANDTPNKHDDNKDTVVRLMEAFARADRAVLDSLMSSTYRQHNPTPDGREPVYRVATILQKAFPDARMEIDDLIAEGDKVAARITMVGTHTGELLGIAPTGKRVQMSSIDIWRIHDGVCIEHWDEVDRVGLLRQIGAGALLKALATRRSRRQILAFAREQGILRRRI